MVATFLSWRNLEESLRANAKDFLNRKGLYSINAQIIGGFDRRIYDILLTALGSFHYAAVWSMSLGKGWLETRFPQRFFLAIAPILKQRL